MSLAPQTKPDLFIIRGDTVTIDVIFPMDITGATVFFTAKPIADLNADDPTDTEAVISVSTTNHVDAPNGHTQIVLSSTDTDVTPAKYYYDLQVKIGSEITSIAARMLQVYGDITRRTS